MEQQGLVKSYSIKDNLSAILQAYKAMYFTGLTSRPPAEGAVVSSIQRYPPTFPASLLMSLCKKTAEEWRLAFLRPSYCTCLTWRNSRALSTDAEVTLVSRNRWSMVTRFGNVGLRYSLIIEGRCDASGMGFRWSPQGFPHSDLLVEGFLACEVVPISGVRFSTLHGCKHRSNAATLMTSENLYVISCSKWSRKGMKADLL